MVKLFAITMMLTVSSIANAQSCTTGSCGTPRLQPMPWMQQSQQPQPQQLQASDQSQWPQCCVIKVIGPGSSDYASGVLTTWNGRLVVATVWHAFRDPYRQVYAFFPSVKTSYWLTLAGTDQAADVAVLTFATAKPSIAPAPLADATPVVQSQITLTGFAHANTFRARATTIRATDGRGIAVWTTTPSIEGESGGAAFDSSGRVCGIISATSTTETVVERIGPLRRLLQRIIRPCQPPKTHVARSKTTVQSQAIITQQIAPAQSQQADTPQQTAEIDYQRLADIVLDRIAADARFRGPKGEPGLPGAVGPPGPRGEPGEPATIDTAAIAAAIAKTLPPITFRTVLPDGTVTDTERVTLGGSLNIMHHRLSEAQ